MLTLKNIKFGYTNEYLLKNVSVTIGPAQKIGLVGVNGAGKSTLMQIIAGKIAPEFGTVNNNFSTGYIAQEISALSHNSNIDTISDFINRDQQYPFAYHKIAKFLSKIGMTDKTPDSTFAQLSGGQKTKAEIIKILLEEPELLLLDEPTNFLDINASRWLMEYLNDYKGAILVISHDLDLMNKGLDKIWLLNEFSKDIEQFKGNYDEFMEQKELENQQLAKRIKKQKKEYKKLLQVSQHLKGMSSNKAKMQGARYREKAMELKNKIPKQHKRSKKIKIEHNIKKKPGHTILTVQNVSKAFRTDDKLNQVLFDINFSLKRRNRLAIIGINGAGKSTLLKIIMKKIEPEDGPNGKAKIKYGYNTEIGYYAQEYDNVNKTNTPLEEFPRNQHQRVRRFLGNFLITQEQVNQRISTLSGGEKTRLALAKIFFHQPNVLVLDEPTTFLDPASQKILKQTLRDYPETIILVSHDKELVKSIEPTHVLLLPEEKFTNFYPSHLNRVEDF